jgi:hypothetical protein
MFVALAGSELDLGTGTTTAPTPPVPSADHFLAPAFVQSLVRELAADAFFCPIMRGEAATFGKPVDRHSATLLDPSHTPPGGMFLVLCGLLFHIDLLSGKVHAVPTKATATAADPTVIIRDMCLRSCDGFPDVLVVDHDPKITSDVFQAFVKSMDSSLIVGSDYHKNTNAKVERANGVIGDTLRPFANGRKDDWDRQLPFAVFTISNAASTLGDGLTPFFIDWGAHLRLPLSGPPADGDPGETPADYAHRMRELTLTERELLAAAQAAHKAKLDAGRVDTVFKVGAVADQGAARCR